MREKTDRSPFEQEVTAAMQERIGAWTPACLPPNELLDLAEAGDAHPNALLLKMHVDDCAYCREQLDMLRETLALTQEADPTIPAPAMVPSEEPQNAPVSLWSRLLGRLRGAPARPSLRFALAAAPALLLLAVSSILWSRMHALDSERLRLKGETTALRKQAETDRKQAKEKETKQSDENARLNEALKKEKNRPVIRLLNFKDGEASLARDNTGKLFLAQPAPPLAQATFNQKSLPIPNHLLAELGMGKDLQLMGAPSDTFRLLAPVGTAVETPKVVFRWEAVPDAVSYTLTIPLGDKEIQSPSIPARKGEREVTWTLSNPKYSLQRGGTYEWYVKAVQAGAPNSGIEAPPKGKHARFRILNVSESRELAQDRQTAGGLHSALAAYYAKYGLLDDAERELRILQKENPESEQVRSLLSALQAQRKGSH